MDKNIKIKISDNTHKKDSEVSDFSIAYSARKIDNAIVSYQIISALKTEDNIIMEVNSTLLSLSENDKKMFLSRFSGSLDKMGIEFRDKKTSVKVKRSILSVALESKKVEGFELFVSIPNNVWCDQEFIKIIPKVGVRYYLTNQSTENNLDTFVNLDEDEKLDQCRMVIFDNILLGSMGINTSILNKDEIIGLLNTDMF